MTKTHEEMDKAHTLLALAIQIDTFPTKEDKTRTLIAMSVLCWALGHDHANFFDRILEELQPLQPKAVETAVQYWNPRTMTIQPRHSAESLIQAFGDQAYHRCLDLGVQASDRHDRVASKDLAKAGVELLMRGYGRHPRREVTQ